MTKLFIVGFPRDIEEIALVELFSVYGIVKTITLVTDIDTGKRKGFGFVHMNDKAGADRAVAALNGINIDDRQLTVRKADSRAEETKFANPVKNLQASGSIQNHNGGNFNKVQKKRRPRI